MFSAVFDGLVDDESGDMASDCTLAILLCAVAENADCIGVDDCKYCD